MMKHFKKILAIVLVLALALSLAVPAAATAEPKLPIAQLLKMKDAGKNPATSDTLVYPYSQTFGATAIKGNSVLLQFKLAQNRPSTDLFGLIILRGSVEDMANSGELEVVEERLYKMSDFYNGSLGMTWKADSRYPVGEYTLVGMLFDKNEEAYEQEYYFVDLYVVDRQIPATNMEVMEVHNGDYSDVTTIMLGETRCYDYILEPYVNTSDRKTKVTVEHPELLSAYVDAGYVYLTCKGLGDTSFTITCGNVKKTVHIDAGRDSLIGFDVAGENTELCVGMTDTVSVKCTPNDVPIILDWESDHPDVVTVKNGVVTAVGTGTANVSVTCAGQTQTVTYTVRAHELPEDAPVSERTATKPAMMVGHCSLCGQDDAVNIIEKAVFTDTDYKAWYSDHVDYVYEQEIMNGSSATTFAPNRTMTRAELVTVLYRIAGSPEVSYDGAFVDIPAGQWYSDAVTWAAQNEIVNGVGNGRFAPTANITREQIATILYRYTQSLGVEMAEGADLAAFPDCDSVSSFALDGMAWAVAEGLITGVSSGGVTTLAPKASATRAQLATIISRYQQMFPADGE